MDAKGFEDNFGFAGRTKDSVNGIQMRIVAAECRQVDALQCVTQTRRRSGELPFCTIEPNVGDRVPDPVWKNSGWENPNRSFRPIPSSILPAWCACLERRGLGNQFLATIREVTHRACHVVR